MTLRRGAGAVLAAVFLSGCSATGKSILPDIAAPEPIGPSASSTSAPLAVAPLTGLPLFNPSVAGRGAVSVKIDNDPKARPQSGLDKADVVIEEKVEGTVVRFLAIFHSRDASLVGPIRSVRSTDPPLVAPVGGVFAFSGGIAPFVSLARRAGVTVVTEDTNESAFIERAGRVRPYRTYAATDELRAAATRLSAPQSLFTYLGPDEPFAPDEGTAAVRATAVFGARTTAQWDFDAESRRWKRSTNGTPHRVEGGGQLAFTTVILQQVGYRNTGYTDRSGAGVDEAVVIGSGEAVILSQGRQVTVRWRKVSAKEPTIYTDAGGKEVRLPPGQTWVSLVPRDGTVSVSSGRVGSTTIPRVGKPGATTTTTRPKTSGFAASAPP